MYAFAEENADGYYQIPKDKIQIPIIFTLKAIKN